VVEAGGVVAEAESLELLSEEKRAGRRSHGGFGVDGLLGAGGEGERGEADYEKGNKESHCG
jgi:hypothetical protein